ncbi:MAG: sigma-70 family RNA polymerase sigma factor [Actinomycetota bacterium]|nr:sigma-70 family RNA polymerase sigma factor [Actinomycetota bacterium]
MRFEDFFEHQYSSVTKALLLVVGDASEAEELAEEAFARAWARWDLVVAMDSPAGYVYRTALHLNRNRLRRLSREPRRQAREADFDPASEVATRDEIRRALAALPVGQREAIVLIEWLGLTAEEAGKVLRIRPSSVRARVHRARAKLRERLGGVDE